MSGFEESTDHPSEPTEENLPNKYSDDWIRWPTWASISSSIMAMSLHLRLQI